MGCKYIMQLHMNTFNCVEFIQMSKTYKGITDNLSMLVATQLPLLLYSLSVLFHAINNYTLLSTQYKIICAIFAKIYWLTLLRYVAQSIQITQRQQLCNFTVLKCTVLSTQLKKDTTANSLLVILGGKVYLNIVIAGIQLQICIYKS